MAPGSKTQFRLSKLGDSYLFHSMFILDITAKVEHVRQVLEAYLQNAGVLMLLQIILLFQVN